ncbi:hypothetical protein [Streptomyces sp. NPDC059786]|uniref:hypothetical protein n=1 Tax=Streptomyces sp. NPDC059786 TaxID=3346946 RepID=UPI003650AF7E
MALIDDIEFYGRAVDAGELTRDRAAELLARDSNGFLTPRAAATWIDRWDGARDRLHGLHCDVVDAIRALENGRPIPEVIDARWREDMRRRARENALRMIRRPLRRNPSEPRRDWGETPQEAAQADRHCFDRDEEI